MFLKSWAPDNLAIHSYLKHDGLGSMPRFVEKFEMKSFDRDRRRLKLKFNYAY